MLIVERNLKKIKSLKKALSHSFVMKDMGPAKQILWMHIVRGWTKKLLWLLQEKYVTKVLQRFDNLAVAKLVYSTLPTNCKLVLKQSPKTKVDKAEMMKIPYASAVESLTYVMVCTRPDVGVVSQFISNLRREHWAIVKWIL